MRVAAQVAVGALDDRHGAGLAGGQAAVSVAATTDTLTIAGYFKRVCVHKKLVH
jgi:hypothetical protein